MQSSSIMIKKQLVVERAEVEAIKIELSPQEAKDLIDAIQFAFDSEVRASTYKKLGELCEVLRYELGRRYENVKTEVASEPIQVAPMP